jgi:Xaa-Pro aminopeptidase
MTNFNKIKPLSDNFYNQTRKLLLSFIEEKGLEGYLVTNPANIFYFTGLKYVTNERPSGFYISKDNKSSLPVNPHN